MKSVDGMVVRKCTISVNKTEYKRSFRGKTIEYPMANRIIGVQHKLSFNNKVIKGRSFKDMVMNNNYVNRDKVEGKQNQQCNRIGTTIGILVKEWLSCIGM